MLKKNTLHSKINLFILGIILLIVTIGCFVAINIFFSIYENEMTRMVTTGITAFEEIIIQENKNWLLSFSDELADPENRLLIKNDPASIQAFHQYIGHANNDALEFVKVTYLDGNSYEKIFADQSIINLASQNTVSSTTKPYFWIDGNAQLGLHLFCRYPLIGSDQIPAGTLLIGLNLADQKRVDYMKNTAALEATVFAGNTRIATTIVKNNENQIGTTLDPAIADMVIDQKTTYTGKATVLGDPYLVAYSPVLNPRDEVVGVLFVGKSMVSIYTIRNRIILYIAILGFLLLLFFYIISNHWLRINITNPIRWVADAMKMISQGQYKVLENMPKAKYEEIEMLQTTMYDMVNELVTGKKNLETAAYIDSITGLPNRVSLYKKYQNSPFTDNSNTLTQVYYIDVDNLKYINNLFGHNVGDSLLRQVGWILKELISRYPHYEVYRISGDEFAICKNGSYDPDEIQHLPQSIIKEFEKSITIGEQIISASVSIGVSGNAYFDGKKCKICTKECQDSLEQLLKKAELAMNQVKMNGKNNFMIFNPSMNEIIQRKASLQQDLKQALKYKQLEIYYQPKFDLASNRYDGFEALVRWNHHERGFIPPLEFIRIAEESNLIIELGDWILEESCRFISNYNLTHQSSYSIAVNISTFQLLNDDFEEKVTKLLEKTGLDPSLLELEITETMLMNSMSIASEKLTFLRERNISIALDDFGTGYSSLTYLKVLPISTVKLDKSFIDDIATDKLSLKIVENVIQIAKNIGLKIVVEGVETIDQLEILKDLPCNKIQGYYFSKPVSELNLTEVLSEYP
ncbi:EAL domain-containing protein [Acetobacterium wieringae]|uniref:EAL domain-containing protein n=1 Tax=Acetobacterium wieringae TaxID=52694 RepID=UPI002B21B58B|nr:EAL domain-containing protein [Acetobacterium wieringae]MEA4807169.1 EAL domain-containing protein [Acetobacterium wieringae]